MKRNVYHLVFKKGFWRLFLTGREVMKFEHTGTSKWLALRWSRGYVGNPSRRPSQLVVHNKDGSIAYEHTYGADPRRTKG